MRVFVTGASGWIGSATVDELLGAGHEVVGLVRSDASAERVRAAGATPLRGDLDDLAALRRGAEEADGVVHLANKHDFEDMAASNRAERASVETFLDVLAGSDRPLLIAAGAAGLTTGRPATETDRSPFHGPDAPRGGAENLVVDGAERGVRTISVRFAPTVHGTGDHGFVRILADLARTRGTASYVGDGSTRWAAVHRSDAARLVRLALEQAPAGSLVHAMAEEGVASREIAEAIGRGLDLPVTSLAPDRAVAELGWIGMFFGMDMSASSTLTQQAYDWTPTGPTLADDLASGSYWA